MDQAERLRELVGGFKSRARVIAVTSGKGGAGKTNLAVNLAVLFVQMGKRAIVIDVDNGLANADVLLSVQPKLNLGQVMAGEISVLDALVPAAGGVLLLPGCTSMRHLSDLEKPEREFLIQSFRELEAYADVILIDTGAGISSNVIQFASAADEAIVVTTPEPTAITDGYAVIKAISRQKGFGRIRLAVNQALSPGEAQRVSERVRLVARRFLGIEVDCLGHISADEHVGRAVRRKCPFVIQFPRCQATEDLRAIAERVYEEEPAPAASGFLKRFSRVINGVLSP
jgi:flagellar biosynthesis protein FlhG